MFVNVKTAEEVNQAGGGGSSLRSTGVAVIQMIEQSICFIFFEANEVSL